MGRAESETARTALGGSSAEPRRLSRSSASFGDQALEPFVGFLVALITCTASFLCRHARSTMLASGLPSSGSCGTHRSPSAQYPELGVLPNSCRGPRLHQRIDQRCALLKCEKSRQFLLTRHCPRSAERGT